MNYLQSMMGITVFLLIGYFFSENRKLISPKKVFIGVLLQFLLAIILIKIPILQTFFLKFNQIVLMIEKATNAGASFMFGHLAGSPLPYKEIIPGGSFIIAFKVLPIILVMSAISSVLFHLGILQFFVRLIGNFLSKTLKVGGVQGLGVAANIFLGIVEAPLLVRPYLTSMSRSTLFIIMTAGMSTVAGTVMILYASILKEVIPESLGHLIIASLISTPAAIILGHLFVPESDTDMNIPMDIKKETYSIMDALVKGSFEGIQLLLSVITMIIVLFALVNLIDQFLYFLPAIGHSQISLKLIFSYFFMPFVWLIGLSPEEVTAGAELMSVKIVLNEFVSYQNLSQLQANTLSEKNLIVMTYAMCGFANFASLGLLVGSMGTLAPNRRAEIVSLSFKSLIAGTLATLMTGAVVQIIL